MRTAAVFVISTTTIASLAGFSGSLGDIIANETSYHFSGVLGAAICVAALALAVDGGARRCAARAHSTRAAHRSARLHRWRQRPRTRRRLGAAVSSYFYSVTSTNQTTPGGG